MTQVDFVSGYGAGDMGNDILLVMAALRLSPIHTSVKQLPWERKRRGIRQEEAKEKERGKS